MAISLGIYPIFRQTHLSKRVDRSCRSGMSSHTVTSRWRCSWCCFRSSWHGRNISKCNGETAAYIQLSLRGYSRSWHVATVLWTDFVGLNFWFSAMKPFPPLFAFVSTHEPNNLALFCDSRSRSCLDLPCKGINSKCGSGQVWKKERQRDRETERDRES